MKKIITLLLSLLVILALTGCQSKKEATNDLTSSLLSGSKIIVGTSPDYPPFESLDASGNPEGFDIDMVNAVVKILNEQQNTNITVQFNTMDFGTIVTALQAKQIDIGVSAFTYSADRDVLFSTPYIVSQQVIVTREDTNIKTAADLAGKKVASGTGTTGAEAASAIEGVEVIYPGDYNVMFQALQAGQIDAVVCDNAVADNYVASMGFVKCEEALVDENMSIIIENSNTTLQQAIDQAISTFVESQEYQDLLAKWELN